MSADDDAEIAALRTQMHNEIGALRAEQRATTDAVQALTVRVELLTQRLAPLTEIESRLRVLERAHDRAGGALAAVAALSTGIGAAVASAFHRLLGP